MNVHFGYYYWNLDYYSSYGDGGYYLNLMLHNYFLKYSYPKQTWPLYVVPMYPLYYYYFVDFPYFPMNH